MNSRKDILPNYIEFAKNKKEMGDFLGPKNLQRKNLLWTLLPIAKENWVGTNWKNAARLSWRKKEERISAIRNTDIHDAENLGLVPVLEPCSDKDSTMEQELANSHAVYDVAIYKMRRVCVTIKKYSVNKPPYSTLHCKGERSLETSCLCQLYIERIQRINVCREL